MKKILSLLLSAALILGVFGWVGCGTTEETLNLGLGVYATVKSSDAIEDKDGQGQATITIAGVLVDSEGKIVKCVIDCADNTVSYTANGEAVANASFETKYEKGDAYNMVAYGGAAKEWYEQADAFGALVVGKTLSEVKALVANGNSADDIVNAGCTIDVSGFVLAVEKAMKTIVASDATKNDTLKLGVSTAQSKKDANEDANGYNQIETTAFIAAVNGEGKITAAKADCIQVKFTFDANGASTFDATKAVATKYEQGASYNMVAYGGAGREWFEQADIFCASCIGKTAGEVSALGVESNGYGNSDIQAAGCTILVDGFIKAASKTKQKTIMGG